MCATGERTKSTRRAVCIEDNCSVLATKWVLSYRGIQCVSELQYIPSPKTLEIPSVEAPLLCFKIKGPSRQFLAPVQVHRKRDRHDI